MAAQLGYRVIAYPATKGHELERNHLIVAACDVLNAAPLQDEEILRSGTWATIRYARKAGKTVIQLKR
jgi:predicted Rossmann fold nucleotide-binding protein DprA/Smf involved in DNA uptake